MKDVTLLRKRRGNGGVAVWCPGRERARSARLRGWRNGRGARGYVRGVQRWVEQRPGLGRLQRERRGRHGELAVGEIVVRGGREMTGGRIAAESLQDLAQRGDGGARERALVRTRGGFAGSGI